LPRAFYSTGWDRITLDWHKNPHAPSSLLPVVQAAMVLEGLRTAEALLFSPSVCFRVFGENVVLCRLIDAFGIGGVEKLLEEEALQFLLWRPTVTYVVTGPKVRGIDPLAPGNHNSTAHSDPQASVEMGLRGGWTQHPWPKLQRIAQLATKLTHLPAKNVSYDAVDSIRKAYDAGSLRTIGFDPGVPRHSLGDEWRKKLAGLAEDIAQGIVLYDLEYDLHESDWAWENLLQLRALASLPNVSSGVERGLVLENLPNIPALIATGVISHGDVVELRNHPATAEFRRWLWAQPNPRDAQAVAEAWLASITERPITDRTWFKIARLSTFSALGGVIGAAVGSPSDIATGALVGAALNQVVGAVDSFGIEALLRKPSPRRFAEVIRQKKAAISMEAGRPTGNRKARRAAAARERHRR